jgi:LysM repeat protein
MNGKTWLVLGGIMVAVVHAATSGNHTTPTRVASASTYAVPAVTYTKPEPPPPPTTYTIQLGDGLRAIADAHGVSLGALLQANGFANSWDTKINPGDVLRLPQATEGKAVAQAAPITRSAATSVQATPQTYQPPAQTYQAPSYAPTQPWAKTCPNGSCFGDTSTVTGNPRTTYVSPHVTKNGTYVGGYYRSHK